MRRRPPAPAHTAPPRLSDTMPAQAQASSPVSRHLARAARQARAKTPIRPKRATTRSRDDFYRRGARAHRGELSQRAFVASGHRTLGDARALALHALRARALGRRSHTDRVLRSLARALPLLR